MPPEVLLRTATTADLPEIGKVLTRTRTAAYPAMPRGVRPDAEVRRWVAGWDLESHEVWVAENDAESDDGLLGYARFTPTWLDDLYVDPAAQGGGIGSALLELVKARRPDGFSLWVFESNTPARGFYARHGLVEAEHTDGADNEEHEPDIRMQWRPRSGPDAQPR